MGIKHSAKIRAIIRRHKMPTLNALRLICLLATFRYVAHLAVWGKPLLGLVIKRWWIASML